MPYLIINNLISDKLSGFKKGDSTVNQILYICHEIFLSFDANPPNEVRAVFLDISKAFDKIWHEGLVFKMKRYGIQGVLLDLLSDFLRPSLPKNCIKWNDIGMGACRSRCPTRICSWPLNVFTLY